MVEKDILNLRKKTSAAQTPWQKEQIKAGFEYFKKLNGRYPSAREIDTFDYLPTSRSIQRSFGGLEKMRLELGFDISLTNLTKGTVRSDKAKETYANAVDLEESFYNYLINQIPEINVHEHKILRPGHICCDFYVYTSASRGFAIDIFYAQDMFTLARTVNIKVSRYKDLTQPVYFVVVGNENLDQQGIDSLMNNKKIPLPKHIKILTEKFFKENIQGIMQHKF